jgi:hypothetical protein
MTETWKSARADAAIHGNLPALQWLRMNSCPWDWSVVYYARIHGHPETVEWAIANGCADPAGVRV